MGKKEESKEGPEAGKQPAAAGDPEPEVLEMLRKLIKPGYEDEFRQRIRLMRENEAMSRESILIEEEIREHQDKHEKLTEETTALRQKRDELQKQVDGLTSQRGSFASRSEQLSASKKSLEDEVVRLSKQNRQHVTAIDKFQDERRGLIS